MTRLSALFSCAMLALIFATGGCLPSPESRTDEQRDPNYLAGRSRVSSGDIDGAIELFEKALDTNPRSAAAHFELGWLYDQHRKDFAAAIHHYQRHLRLQPDSEYADRVKGRIHLCKVELAREVILDPVTQELQRDIDRLHAENVILRRELESVRTELANRTAALQAQREAAAPPVAPQRIAVPQTGPATSPAPPVVAPSRTQQHRQHTVSQGETLASISRRYGVRLDRLIQANPGIDPSRLQVGQVVTVPRQ